MGGVKNCLSETKWRSGTIYLTADHVGGALGLEDITEDPRPN